MVTGKFNGLFFYFFLFFTCNLFAARFTSAVIGIDGLTCSACSFSTEQSIRKLDFVENVNMELNENMATITFKKDKEISIDAIVRRVYAAGFSVRSVKAIFILKNRSSSATMFSNWVLQHFMS